MGINKVFIIGAWMSDQKRITGGIIEDTKCCCFSWEKTVRRKICIAISFLFLYYSTLFFSLSLADIKH